MASVTENIARLERELGMDETPDYLRPAPDDEQLREMAERVEALEALTRHPSWEILYDAVKQETAKLQYRLIMGRCDSWEQYLTDSARIKGMLDVFKLPEKARAALPVRHDT